MSKQRDNDRPDEAAVDQAQSPQVVEQPPLAEADNTSTERASSAEDQVEALRSEIEQVNARLLRVSADYQNYVKRSEQNLTDAREQEIMQVAKALVTVLDHFDRAIEVDEAKTTTEGLLKGVQIVRDELLATLERFGVVRFDVRKGAAFDPNRHEALMRQSVDDVAANHVISQLQSGYVLGDKTLRPAQVSVAAEKSENDETPAKSSAVDDDGQEADREG